MWIETEASALHDDGARSTMFCHRRGGLMSPHAASGLAWRLQAVDDVGLLIATAERPGRRTRGSLLH